jgi:hypothetical protein
MEADWNGQFGFVVALRLNAVARADVNVVSSIRGTIHSKDLPV